MSPDESIRILPFIYFEVTKLSADVFNLLVLSALAWKLLLAYLGYRCYCTILHGRPMPSWKLTMFLTLGSMIWVNTGWYPSLDSFMNACRAQENTYCPRARHHSHHNCIMDFIPVEYVRIVPFVYFDANVFSMAPLAGAMILYLILWCLLRLYLIFYKALGVVFFDKPLPMKLLIVCVLDSATYRYFDWFGSLDLLVKRYIPLLEAARLHRRCYFVLWDVGPSNE